MLDIKQFRECVVCPVLKQIKRWSPSAEELVLATIVHESHLVFLKQNGGGPALGIGQMEPATHDDIWDNYLAYRPDLAEMIKILAAGGKGTAAQLPWNMGYAVAMARIVFCRAPEALPSANDLPAMAAYWKQHYNTPLGAGTADDFMNNYNRIVKGKGK